MIWDGNLKIYIELIHPKTFVKHKNKSTSLQIELHNKSGLGQIESVVIFFLWKTTKNKFEFII